jgi:hypothetical protein
MTLVLKAVSLFAQHIQCLILQHKHVNAIKDTIGSMVGALNVIMVKFLIILGVAIYRADLIMFSMEKTVFVHSA